MGKIYSACYRAVLGVLLLIFGAGSARPQVLNRFRSVAEVGGFAATARQLPFWLRANQFGTVPLDGPAGTLRLETHLVYRWPLPDDSVARFDWGAGVAAVGNGGGGGPPLLLPEAYAKVRYGPLELWAGRRREVLGLGDSALTSGAFSWSGNALPVPKVQLGLPRYVSLRFLKNWVAVKGFYAHGWFNVPYIQRAFLHQKALYFRFGSSRGRVAVHAGLIHHVLWGGQAEYLRGSSLAVNGQLTTAFRDYLPGVVLGKIAAEPRNGRYTTFDGENRIGNHVGNYDLAFDVRLNRARLLVYTQHPFEDTSGLLLLNLPDGLYGLRWQSEAGGSSSYFQLKTLLFEGLYTKNQAGGAFNIPGSRFRGADNYFNHSQYVQGWSYFDRGLGTPFLPLDRELRAGVGMGQRYFSNNRVWVVHAGAEALVAKRVVFRAKTSYSHNFGTYARPFARPLPQFSVLLDVRVPLPGMDGGAVVGGLACDRGQLYPNTFGTYLGLRKLWAANQRR